MKRSLLASAPLNVYLNPIRAAIAETTPKRSDYHRGEGSNDDERAGRSPRDRARNDWERSRRVARAAMDEPIEINEKEDPLGACIESSGRRASSKGFLSVNRWPRYKMELWMDRPAPLKSRQWWE